jgi:hypothetical protein
MGEAEFKPSAISNEGSHTKAYITLRRICHEVRKVSSARPQ